MAKHKYSVYELDMLSDFDLKHLQDCGDIRPTSEILPSLNGEPADDAIRQKLYGMDPVPAAPVV